MAIHERFCAVNAEHPSEGTENAQPNDEIRCRNCGQTDTYFAMIASAQSFVTDKFAEGELPDRQYRWVVAGFERDR